MVRPRCLRSWTSIACPRANSKWPGRKRFREKRPNRRHLIQPSACPRASLKPRESKVAAASALVRTLPRTSPPSALLAPRPNLWPSRKYSRPGSRPIGSGGALTRVGRPYKKRPTGSYTSKWSSTPKSDSAWPASATTPPTPQVTRALSRPSRSSKAQRGPSLETVHS